MKIRHRQESPFNLFVVSLFVFTIYHIAAKETAADPCVWVPRVLGF